MTLITCIHHIQIRNFIILLEVLMNDCQSLCFTELEDIEEEKNGVSWHLGWGSQNKEGS